jgi:hypothetical protein
MLQKLECIHYNPGKRGHLNDVVDWSYCSAHNHVGVPRMVPVIPEWK